MIQYWLAALRGGMEGA